MGFFDRFYYGKAGKADYTVEDLPQNRLQLFFQVLRVRFFGLFQVNLVQVLFWLPFLLWTLINMAVFNNLSAEAIEQGTLGTTALWDSLMQLLFTYLLGLVPCLLITGPSSAGASYITRNWARDEHAFIWTDFKDAVKGNWKQALGVSLVTSVLPFLVFFVYSFYGQLTPEYPILVVAQVLIVMLGVILALALTVIYPMMVTYHLTFRQLWRNAILLAVGRLPQMIALRLLTLLPILLALLSLLMGSLIGLFLVFLYYLVFGFAFHRLIYASYANALFDHFLNPQISGASIGKGLRPKDLDDDDEDDADELPDEPA